MLPLIAAFQLFFIIKWLKSTRARAGNLASFVHSIRKSQSDTMEANILDIIICLNNSMLVGHDNSFKFALTKYSMISNADAKTDFLHSELVFILIFVVPSMRCINHL